MTDLLTANADLRGTSGEDRRRRPTSPWSMLVYGRRRGPRRADERRESYFSDRPSPGIVMLAAILMVFSVVDAMSTLVLLEGGFEEANPAMRFLLGYGVGVFLLGKFAITTIGLAVLLVCGNYRLRLARRWKVGHLLAGLVGVYATLNVYEAVLLITR